MRVLLYVLFPLALSAQYELVRPPMRRDPPVMAPRASPDQALPAAPVSSDDPSLFPASGSAGQGASPVVALRSATAESARVDRLDAASTRAESGDASLVWITLEPQGPEVLKAALGSRVRGIAIVECEVCSLSGNPVAVPAARIYQFAISHKMKAISGLLGNATLTASSNQSWRKGVVDVLKILSGSGSILTASGVVQASKTWTVGLISAAQLFELLSTALKERIPDTGVVQRHILTGTLLLQPRECHSSLMLVQYRKDLQSVEGEWK